MRLEGSKSGSGADLLKSAEEALNDPLTEESGTGRESVYADFKKYVLNQDDVTRTKKDLSDRVVVGPEVNGPDEAVLPEKESDAIDKAAYQLSEKINNLINDSIDTKEADSYQVNTFVAEKAKTANELLAEFLSEDITESKVGKDIISCLVSGLKELAGLHKDAAGTHYGLNKKKCSIGRLSKLRDILKNLSDAIARNFNANSDRLATSDEMSKDEEVVSAGVVSGKINEIDEDDFKRVDSEFLKSDSKEKTSGLNKGGSDFDIFLKNKLKKHKFSSGELNLIIKGFSSAAEDEKKVIVEKINNYFAKKAAELSGLEPVVNCMMLLTDMSSSDEVVRLINASRRLKEVPRINSITEISFEEIAELDQDIALLSTLNTDVGVSKRIFLSNPLAEKNSSSIFARLLVKTFFSENQQVSLTKAQGLFKKMVAYLSNTPDGDGSQLKPLYDFALGNQTTIDSMLSNVESVDELFSFLSAHKHYMNLRGVEKKFAAASSLIDRVDGDNLLAQDAVAKVKAVRDSRASLSAIRDDIEKMVDAQVLSVLANYENNGLKDDCNKVAEITRNIYEWFSNNDDYDNLKFSVKEQGDMRDKLSENNKKVIDKLTFIKAGKTVSNTADKDRVISRIEEIISVLSNDSESFSNNRTQLADAHRKIFDAFIEGDITKSQCEELFLTLFSSQSTLAIAKVDTDHMATFSKKVVEEIDEKLQKHEESLLLESKKIEKQRFLKKFGEKKDRLIAINREMERVSKIRSALDIMQQIPCSNDSLGSVIDLLSKKVGQCENDHWVLAVKKDIKALAEKKDNSVALGGVENWPAMLDKHLSDIKGSFENIEIIPGAGKNQDNTLSLKKGIGEIEGVLDLFSCFSDKDKERQQIKQAIDANFRSYLKRLKLYSDEGLSPVAVMKIFTKILAASKKIKIIMAQKNLVFSQDLEKALDLNGLEVLLDVSKKRKEFIDGYISVIEEMDLLLIEDKVQIDDRVKDISGKAHELKSKLVNDFDGRVAGKNSDDEDIEYKSKSDAATIVKFDNNNKTATANFLVGIEGVFNESLKNILANKGEATDIGLAGEVRQAILPKLSGRKNDEVNKKQAHKMLSEFNRSFLSKYFNVDFDDFSISLKGGLFSEEDSSSDAKTVRHEKIKNFLNDEPMQSYDISVFIDNLKDLASSSSGIKKQAKEYLERAPHAWKDVFTCDESGKYSSIAVKPDYVGDSLQKDVVRLQKGMLSRFWGQALPIKDMAELRLAKIEIADAVNYKNRSQRKESMLNELNRIKEDIEKSTIVFKKEKKLLVIEKAINDLKGLDVKNSSFRLNSAGVIEQACSSFIKVIPFYEMTESKFMMSLEDMHLKWRE